jgi:hypothetical protein
MLPDERAFVSPLTHVEPEPIPLIVVLVVTRFRQDSALGEEAHAHMFDPEQPTQLPIGLGLHLRTFIHHNRRWSGCIKCVT